MLEEKEANNFTSETFGIFYPISTVIGKSVMVKLYEPTNYLTDAIISVGKVHKKISAENTTKVFTCSVKIKGEKFVGFANCFQTSYKPFPFSVSF